MKLSLSAPRLLSVSRTLSLLLMEACGVQSIVSIKGVVIIAHGSVWRFSLCNKYIHTATVTAVETFIIYPTFVRCLIYNLMIRMTYILRVC